MRRCPGNVPGGLYISHGDPALKRAVTLVLPNPNPDLPHGDMHGLLFGGINNQDQVVGDVEVADAQVDGVHSRRAVIFWQGGHVLNLQDAPLMAAKSSGNKLAAEAKTANTSPAKAPEPVHYYDGPGGPAVDRMTFVPTNVNDGGDILGFLVGPAANAELPVLWTHGRWRIIQMPDAVAAMTPLGLNADYDIVGVGWLPPPQNNTSDKKKPKDTDVGMRPPRTAALVRNHQMLGLNNCIPNDSGWNLEAAISINGGGEIVGWGRFKGEPASFLLLPAPRPDPGPGGTSVGASG